ncbi:amidohydrolase [Sediminivirga luteola]|uniref:Hydrolase n=1 Tax=Sediminivirga luteola TaxID=1774748 RepID=A0A8J2TXK6_9MICO|nr:amidohydrolase [Sediminivirga luteola]MCI2266682.1 amidohydrolase [Sediminivirga luteola]GGA13115.1 hydrolase [Sediminivirga luteola]
MTDLIIHGARIRTMTAGEPGVASQTALAISEGRISRLGTDAEILALAGDGTEIVDARGATLTPGLIDSHLHPVWGAELTVGLDLGGITDLDEVRAVIAEEAARLPEGAWVRGWNLDYKVFARQDTDTLDIRGELFDEAAGGRPVALVLYDLHTGVGNAAALAAAGIDGTETFADASEIVVDAEGRPTGELREIPAYMKLLDAAPGQDAATLARRTRDELAGMAATGVTGAAVMDGRLSTLEVLDEVERMPGGLPVRLHIAMWHQPGDDDAAVAERIGLLGRGGDRYRVALIKMFIDGVIDTGTAWLHEPDTQGASAEPFWHSLDRYAEVCRAYHDAGYQLTTHSCGDAGVAQAVQVYRTLGKAANGAPHRIEHLETLTDEDVRALAESGTVASMQPLHMQWREGDHSDSWTVRLGPKRAAHAFRVRDVLRAGAPIALGSDWPVAQNDVRLGLAWARLRRTPGDPQAPVFEPDQRLSGEQALLGYTRWAAEALGRDDLGVIAPGAAADLALWAQDPVEAGGDELTGIRVLLTTIGGQPVHREDHLG